MVFRPIHAINIVGKSYCVSPEEYLYPEIRADLEASVSGMPVSLDAAYIIYWQEVSLLDDNAFRLLQEGRWVRAVARMGFKITC